MSTIALVPARNGSKGISQKNRRMLTDADGNGLSLRWLAVKCAMEAGVDLVALSADEPPHLPERDDRFVSSWYRTGIYQPIERPADLAQDDTPMLAVVQHALRQIPGEPSDVICLLQPTQPFRRPEHIQQAITLLRESGADSVVSVVPLPLTHSPDLVLRIGSVALGPIGSIKVTSIATGALMPWDGSEWDDLPPARQFAEPAYIRDGTVYAFYRKTVTEHGSIYGQDVRPLIIDPADSCELDTEEQWKEVEARWNASGRK